MAQNVSDKKSALVQVMAYYRLDGKAPYSESIVIQIYFTLCCHKATMSHVYVLLY